MSDVFTWVPSYGSEVEYEPRVLKAQFGDGYVQRTEDGINSTPETWNNTFENIGLTDATAIVTFLKAHKTVAFTWTTPNGDALNFICEKWKRSYPDGATFTITATFVQDFAP